MDSAVNQEAEARLAHAKKLLSKFQNRQTEQKEEVSSRSANNYTPEQQVSQHSNQSSTVFVNTSSLNGSLHSSRSSSFVNVDHAEPSMNAEITSLKAALAEKDKYLNETTTKLNSLHNHYVQIYEAYNKLVEQNSQQGRSEETNRQIVQLQTALAIAVQEKTALQTEVRNVKAHSKALDAELEMFRHRGITGPSTDSFKINSLMEENKKLSERVTAQAEALSDQRKENSDLEAKIVVLNQDKNDVQNRLRYVYQEKEGLQAALDQLRHELGMKEIYIRQLSKNLSDNDAGHTIEAFAEEKKRFEMEIAKNRMIIQKLTDENNGAKQYYSECLQQTKDRIRVLEDELHDLKSKHQNAETAKCYLQEELEMFRRQTQQSLVKREDGKEILQATVEPIFEDKVGKEEHEALKNSLQKLEHEFNEQAALISELNKAIAVKDEKVNELSNNLEEKSKTLQRLKEELKRDEKLNADFKSLAEQLQNERATVSRAVAQNMDLKEQLGELQDRLVEVTNRCAEQEDERQRAVAMVKNLSKRLEEMDSNGNHQASQSVDEFQKQAYDLPIVPELLEKHIESMGYLSEDHNRQLIEISKAIKRIIKKYHPHTAAEELDQLTELPDIIVNRLPSHHHQHNGTVPPPPTPKNDASTMVDQDLAKNLPSPAVLETALQTAAKEALETEEMEVNNEQHEETVEREDEDQAINENSRPESSQYIENPNYYGTPHRGNLEIPHPHPHPHYHDHQFPKVDNSDSESDSGDSDASDSDASISQADDMNGSLDHFLQNPGPGETETVKRIRKALGTAIDTHKMTELENQKLRVEIQQLVEKNKQLQYWLTHVESENESIGDYIQLYRIQREKIKEKLKEQEQNAEDWRCYSEQTKQQLIQFVSILVGTLKKSYRIHAELVDEPSKEERLEASLEEAGLVDKDHQSRVEKEEKYRSESPQERIHDSLIEAGLVDPDSPGDRHKSRREDLGPERPPGPENCAIHKLIQFLNELRESEPKPEDLKQFASLIHDAPEPFDPCLHCSECRGAMKHL
ncbi:unnamed protein product [Bursaphelenchus xylophilus]|uniref:(pine wood nematode) hypothetical protein n=1 Tax=Bursaphelenchus xylophilus TaxID=6326 RepID=A0A1I7SXB0_BURXY|nr:unnamed protein product [Bursaphelenchus xylophilus]CAG9100298.1 unnamed protein product [Bursaphelenchus xylophilus]